jgi:hypothetical protein
LQAGTDHLLENFCTQILPSRPVGSCLFVTFRMYNVRMEL